MLFIYNNICITNIFCYVDEKVIAIQNYFFERYVGGPKSSDFWPTIKSFLSKKGSSSNNHIALSENGEIIHDPAKVSEVFNEVLDRFLFNFINMISLLSIIFRQALASTTIAP
jgi:hypothetical protein